MKAANRTYMRQMIVAMGFYVVLVIVSVWLIGRMEETIWRIPIALLPVIPAAFALRAFIRYLNSIDEFMQKMQLNAIAIAAGATGMITFAYGFLENAGLPRLSWTFIFPLMIAIWGIALTIIERRYR
ncbi:MAG: hypothetical protein M9928_03850 [Anaerolineae bacterium]|nr:hypothetical protein [Anaerolineae bacterium]MCO5204138.1 hypothetical protein [Anaerolineae bacterium]